MKQSTPRALVATLSLAFLAPSLCAQLIETPGHTGHTEHTGAWLDTARARLAEAEYHYRSTSGAFSAPNRAQALRSRITGTGLEVTPREEAPGSWVLHLRTKAIGRADSLALLGDAAPTARAGRVELEHGPVTEWFENRPTGLEQGWTLDRAPAGEGELCLDVELGEAFYLRIDPDRRGGVLVHRTRDLELTYGGLIAFDATGQDLPAALERTPTGFRIRVDDSGALYPVTIDPVLESAGWAREGNQAGAQLGVALAGLGDVNGDGFADFAIGAATYDGGLVNEGRVWVYHGSSNGPVGPIWTVDGGQVGALYGRELAAAGDVNGDGYDDMLVSAPFWENGQTEEGHIWVYAGGPSGLAHAAIFRVEGNQAFARFGDAVAGIGDINGDGFDDIAASAPRWDAGETNEGHVWVYHGSAGGPVAPAAFRAEGNASGLEYGYTLAGAGDLNGDGFSDLVVGAQSYDGAFANEGRIWVYHGSSSGVVTPAAIRINGGQNAAAYGFSIAGIGDVNLDGYDDLAVGAPQFDNGETNEGQVWVYHGSASGLSTPAAWRNEGDQDTARYGSQITGAGDVNGDGYDDVLVGAPMFKNPDINEGAAFLLQGSDLVGTPYCVTSFNSTGAAASIRAVGSPSSAAGMLELIADDVPNTPGLFFHGSTQIATPFGNGIRCAGGAVVRGAFAVGSNNQATYRYDNSSPRHSVGGFVGTTRHFQFWFRDGSAGGAGFNTSTGVSVTIAP